MTKTTTAKAWTSAISVIAMYALARFTGTVEMPPVEEIGQALTDIGVALVAAAVSWGMTWAVPNKEKS